MLDMVYEDDSDDDGSVKSYVCWWHFKSNISLVQLIQSVSFDNYVLLKMRFSICFKAL